MPDLPDLPVPGQPGEPAMADLGGLFGMAMDLQQQVVAAQEEAATRVVEGQAGGGAVRIEVTGGFEFRSVTIAPEALDPDDVEMLQDLILAALHDAVGRVNDLLAAADPLAAMGGLDIGSVLGGLTGALGAPDEDAAGEDGDGGATGGPPS